jgi:hypothetical protein
MRGRERAHRCEDVLWRCMFWEDYRMKKMLKMSASYIVERGKVKKVG